MFSLNWRNTRSWGTSSSIKSLLGDMIQTYKIIKGIDNMDSTKHFVSSASCHHLATRLSTIVTDNGPSASTGLNRTASSTSIRANFFSQKIAPYWNNLPVPIREAVSVDDFKIKYDEHLSQSRRDILYCVTIYHLYALFALLWLINLYYILY